MAGKLQNRLAMLAARQFGVVARRQLVALGFSRHEIDGLLKRGWLHPLYRAVFAVGHESVSIQGRWMAATLFAGDQSVLSHRAAAAHLALLPGTWIEVTTPRPRRSSKDLIAHTSVLPRDERTIHSGIPVTTATRTIFDLAAVEPRQRVERAINEAEFQQHVLDLPAMVVRHPRTPGVALVRQILAADDIPVTRSVLEELFLALVDELGLPRPRTNMRIQLPTGAWIEADCVWPDKRLIVELDGRTTHARKAAFKRDRRRDRALAAAGWRCVRVTWQDLHEDVAALAADLMTLLGVDA